MSKTTTMNHRTDGVVSDIKDAFKDVGDSLVEKGKEVVSDIKEEGADLLDDALGKGQKMMRRPVKWAKKNPALAIACAIGLAWLLFGRGGKE